MAIQSITLDPAAVAYTDDEIVGKVNAAAVNITRAGAIEAAARPLVAGEVGITELLGGVAKESLDAMQDTERGYPKTDPQTGEYKIVSIQVDATEKLRTDYDDVPIP